MDDRASTNTGERQRAALLHVITPHGETVVPLIEHDLRIGRLQENEVTVDSIAVDDLHARLVREGESFRFHQVSRSHPTFLNGAHVDDYVLRPEDHLEIAPESDDAVTLVYEAPRAVIIGDLRVVEGTSVEEATVERKSWRLDLPARGTLILGRSGDCDLVLPAIMVSRHHARLDLTDGQPVISEIGHTSGIFVNGRRVHHETVAVGDIVRLGPFKIEFGEDTIAYQDDRQSVQLDSHHVSRIIGKKQILDGITFSAHPGEVLAIAGTSGAGKSTLLYALTGIIPPTSGRVLVNGSDLYQSFDALQPLLGYVPQRDILPLQLPVERALQYVARLRLPSDVSREEIDERVQDVMRSLDLFHRRDVILGSLSGGQQKRASIAAELIGRPGLFFLDEPTSGLDPGLARRVTRIMRTMAEEHSTVVVISHDVEGLEAADRILLLASGGRVAYIGPPQEALAYFQVDDLADVYPRIESEDAEVWQRRYQESEHYRQEVLPILQHTEAEAAAEGAAEVEHAPVVIGQRGSPVSAWRQFTVSVQRYAESMWRDRTTLAVLLAQAPVIAVLLALVANATDMQPPPPAAIEQAGVFGIPAAKLATPLAVMLAATATWFGAINAAREIIKEMPIFLRDRLSGLRIAPYLMSKVAVLTLLCVAQTAVLIAIMAIAVDLPADGVIMWGPLEIWISLALAALAALGIGLLISASVGNPDRAQSLVPIILIPQLIFIGGPSLGSAGQFISNFTVTRWAGEAMKISSGIPYKEEFDPASGFGTGDLLVHWLALALMAVVLIGLAGIQLWRRRAG